MRKKDDMRHARIVGIFMLLVLFVIGVICFFSYKDKKNDLEVNGNEGNEEMEYVSIQEKGGYRNSYYNQIKIHDSCIYYCDGRSLYRYNMESDEKQSISEGNYYLGDIADNELLILKIPMGSSAEEESCICSLDLESNRLENIYTIPDNGWNYCSPSIVEGNIICCEEALGADTAFHFFKKDGNKLEEVEYSYFDLPKDGFISAADKSIKEYGVYTNVNYSSDTLNIMNTEGTILASIARNYMDYMFTPKGFVYTDENSNIHLRPLSGDYKNDVIIYPSGKEFFNYKTSDDLGICGYINDGESVKIARMDWNGNISILASEKGTIQDEALSKLSAFGDMVVYLWDYELKIVK